MTPGLMHPFIERALGHAWRALRACAREGEGAQAMIEYALLAALLSTIAVTAITQIGPALQGNYEQVVNGLDTTVANVAHQVRHCPPPWARGHPPGCP